MSAYVFDLENADASYTEFLTEEVIGTETRNVMEDGNMVEKVIDIKVRKYQLALGARFQHG